MLGTNFICYIFSSFFQQNSDIFPLLSPAYLKNVEQLCRNRFGPHFPSLLPFQKILKRTKKLKKPTPANKHIASPQLLFASASSSVKAFRNSSPKLSQNSLANSSGEIPEWSPEEFACIETEKQAENSTLFDHSHQLAYSKNGTLVNLFVLETEHVRRARGLEVLRTRVESKSAYSQIAGTGGRNVIQGSVVTEMTTRRMLTTHTITLHTLFLSLPQ